MLINSNYQKLPPGTSIEELIPCNYPGCKQFFKSRFSCKRHQLVHTKEKKFLCQQCGKAFSFAQHLREHNYKHANIKPYVCGINGCSESFRHSSELSLHRRIHPGYRLKKYHYVEKTKASKKLSEESKVRLEKALKGETTDSNMESSGSKEKVRIVLENQERSQVNDLFGLDMIFLKYLHNITEQNDKMGRPELPLPGIEWRREGIVV